MSDSREGKAKVKLEATRTAEENKLVNNLMRDLYSVYTENDPDLDLEVNAVWDLLVGFEADVLASAVVQLTKVLTDLAEDIRAMHPKATKDGIAAHILMLAKQNSAE
jgi:hypothetical protein